MMIFKKVYRIFAGILLVSMLLTMIGCSNDELTIGKPAPVFKLNDLNGQATALNSFKGKTVFLHFWDMTYQPCVDEMPIFQQLHQEWSKDGHVVLLTVEATSSAESVKTFMKTHSYTFTVLTDEQFKTAEKYEVQYVPNSFLIGPEGILKVNIAGIFKNKEGLLKQLDGYLP